MERRDWLKWLALFTAFATGALIAESAEDPPSGSSTPMPGLTVADLEQQLKSGLKARRQLEFDFIKTVVQMVKDKQLPIEIVQSTYLWARRRQPYPFPYFERALRERASKVGISVPQAVAQ